MKFRIALALGAALFATPLAAQDKPAPKPEQRDDAAIPVSYTHLTLPTIYSV